MRMVPIENNAQRDERSDVGAGAAYWAAAIMTIINALTSAGFSVAGVFEKAPSPIDAARIFALYAAARSVPLLLVVVALVAIRSKRGLGALAIVMGLVQACDACVGVLQHDPSKTIGPAVFAVLTFVAARFLLKPQALTNHR